MNADKYEQAEKIISKLSIWIDDKSLLKSVVARARKLEADVQEWEKISDKQVGHLTRNGKEIMQLTEEKARLEYAIKDIEEIIKSTQIS